ncbi:MAG: sugar phosphate isomerase/epimerase [Phycisphaerae bacterium]|nr:sugar phosphate isomerase/epimerase [Phycisphaerae bacterium]
MRMRTLMLAGLTGLAGLASLASAAEPMYPKLKWDVGIRDVYLGGLKKPDVWTAAKAIGVRRLECVVDKELSCPGLFEGGEQPYRIDTPESRSKLMKALKDHDMSISCLCAVISAPDADHVKWITRVVEACSEMKVPVVMMPLGYGGKSDEAYIAESVGFLNDLVAVAKRTGVQLTIENLGRYLNREEIVVPIMKGVPTDQVGLANDICNMYWYGHPIDKLYDLAKAVAPYVRYVHVKNIKYPEDKKNVQRKPGWEYGKYAEPVRTGDIDFARILRIYSDAGFKGDVTIEDDSKGKFDAKGQERVFSEDVKLLREIIAKMTPM